MEIFQANNIVKEYAGHVALSSVSISVKEASIFGLLGPNGAGKTTLIRIINQITAPDSGELFFEGRPMKANDIDQIGYLPEERGLYKKMKVGEQALYLAQLKGMSKRDALKSLKYWFEKFEINAWWNRKVEELSKGMQQKVQFISTVLHDPDLLILDEPFSGLDPLNVEFLIDVISEFKTKEKTIIFSTHLMETAEKLCSDILLINKARKVISGSLREVKESYGRNLIALRAEGGEPVLGDRTIVARRVSHADEIILHLADGTDPQLLLKRLIESGAIVSKFEKVEASLNDIFIDKVREK